MGNFFRALADYINIVWLLMESKTPFGRPAPLVTAEPDNELFICIYDKYGQLPLTHSSIDPGTYRIGGQRTLRRACATAQSRQSPRRSHTQSIESDVKECSYLDLEV